MKLGNKLAGLRALWHFDNRWQLIANRALFPKETLLVYRKHDLEFLVDHAGYDHNGTRLCLISDIYSRFLPKMTLGESISVFDLGANGGGFPLMLHLYGKRFSHLVCVEMNPNTFRRLQYNVSRNICGRQAFINGAICGARRQFNLSLGRGDISDSIYQAGDHQPTGRSDYLIEGYTFDELFRSHFGTSPVDICKMDIEGAEYEVMASSERDCLRFCRYLLVELHAAPIEKQDQFCNTLAEIGFSPRASGDNRVPGERLYRNERLS